MFLTWSNQKEEIVVNAVISNEVLLKWNYIYCSYDSEVFNGEDFSLLGSIKTGRRTQYFACTMQSLTHIASRVRLKLGVDTVDFYLDKLCPPSFRCHRDAFFMVWCEVIKALKCESNSSVTMAVRHKFRISNVLEANVRELIVTIDATKIESSHFSGGVETLTAISDCHFNENAILSNLAAMTAIALNTGVVYGGMEIDIERTRRAISELRDL